jgi:hypothetical protein
MICQKKPPLKANEFAAFVAAAKKTRGRNLYANIMKSIVWQREVPPPEAQRIVATLESQLISVVPESVLGLDGTTYELLIERGFNRIRFTWWGEPPRAWRVLRELSNTLLDLADAASVIDAEQSDTRKQLMQQVQKELDNQTAILRRKTVELNREHNSRCQDLVQTLCKAGLTCPFCGVRSSDIRFVDKSPTDKSYFICKACGRSFRPEDIKSSRGTGRRS